MKLIVLTALVAVCGAAKLDRSYLPPASAQTAGGSDGDLSAPVFRSSQNNAGLSLPKGGYTNDHQGIIVDAAAAGTRSAGPLETGLGAPRPSYGSEASKVGDAAFRAAAPQSHQSSPQNDFGSQYGSNSQSGQSQSAPNQGNAPQSYEPEAQSNARPQAAQDRQANIVRYDSDVGAEHFNYAFETDNGIVAEENGVATNGVQAQGGFSYKSDDGQTYSVSYIADENGYQPTGAHLPTPPPIPEEILKSIEKNAQEAANGVVDDGSYDAKKYNEGDYSENANDRYSNEQPNKGSENGVDVSASGSIVNQNIQQLENEYLPSHQPQAQQSQPQRSRPSNQQLSDRPSYQPQASQRQPIQPQQQPSYSNQQSVQSQPAQPQWSQQNSQPQNARPQSHQPQIPEQQSTRQPWSQQKNIQQQPQPSWSQTNNQKQNSRKQYQHQPQIPQQQPTQQPWSQQNNIQPQNAQAQPEQPQWSQSNSQPQNARPQSNQQPQQYQPQPQISQQQSTRQPWSQQSAQSQNAQPEQPQWSQSSQLQNARPQSYQQQPQIPKQQAAPQPWWQQNKNQPQSAQPQSAQPQWAQPNNKPQNTRAQSNQQPQQSPPQWSQPQNAAQPEPHQPWSQANTQPQGRPAYQQQPLNQPKLPQHSQHQQQQGSQSSASASASFNSGSNAFQASYLPPRSNPQNIALRYPSPRPSSQPTQVLTSQNEPAEVPAQIQQLPLEHANENPAEVQDDDVALPSYQEKPIGASSHVNVAPPILPPSFSASAHASVNIGGQSSQNKGKPSYLPPQQSSQTESTEQPTYDSPVDQVDEEDVIIDENKQDGPTAAVPDFIKYGAQSSYEHSSHSFASEPTQNYQSNSYGSSENQDQSQSSSPENQSNQPENSQGLYDYQQPQSYNNQPHVPSSQASPTASAEPSSASSVSSPATRYPQPPTLAPPTASAIPESESTSSAEGSVENSVSPTASNRYLQPSAPSHPQQTEAIAKPFRQQQPFGQRQNTPQQPQQSQFGQRIRPQPQSYNQQSQQPSPAAQPSQAQPQPNYYQQPQSSYIPPQSSRRQPQIPQQPLSHQLPSQSPQLQASQPLSPKSSPQPQQYNSYQQSSSQAPQYQNVQQPTQSSYNQQDQPNSYQYIQPQEQLLEIPQGPQSYLDQQPLNSYQQPLNYQPNEPTPNQSEDSNNPLTPNASAQLNDQESYGIPEEQHTANDVIAEDSAPEVIAAGQPEEQSNQPDLQTSDNSEGSNPDVKSPEQNLFAAASAGLPNHGYRSPVAGAGEVFDSQRQQPSNSYDDQTGYHY